MSVYDSNYQVVYPAHNKLREASVEYEDVTPRYNYPYADTVSTYFTGEDVREKSHSNYENFHDPQALLAKEINEDEDFKENNFIGNYNFKTNFI